MESVRLSVEMLWNRGESTDHERTSERVLSKET
jgi:hypothetical protein